MAALPQPQIQNDPIINFPNLYKNGLVISHLSATTLSIGPGACRDSNNVIDIELGSPNVENEVEPSSLILNMAINGANGLDTGSITQDTMYSIYLIADSRYYLQTACIATLVTNKVPLIPQGYDSYRLIGYWSTQSGSAVFNLGYYAGLGNDLTFYYDQQQQVLSGGTAASITVIPLDAVVPSVDNAEVGIQAVFTASSAAVTNNWYNGSGSGNNYIIIYSQVASVPISEQMELCTGPLALSSGIPTVEYAVAAGGTVNAYVTYFHVSV